MNPNADRNWTFVNECLKHHKKVPNLCKVMNRYDYRIQIEEDTLNVITVSSSEGNIVLQEFGAPYVRIKHDSMLVFSGTEFVFLHFCTGKIVRFDGVYPLLNSADVFFDPFTSCVCLWVWNGSCLNSHCSDGTVKRYPLIEPTDGYMHVLNSSTCVYSSPTRMSIYKYGKLIHETNNPKRMIKQILYLYNIDKYFVQNDRYFVIVRKHEISKMFEPSDDLLHFDSSGIVYFTKYQDIVMYESNKHLCIAQTIPPYQISLARLGDTLRHLHFDDTKLRVQASNGTHFFSMFPMSFTDSTSIDTTFE